MRNSKTMPLSIYGMPQGTLLYYTYSFSLAVFVVVNGIPDIIEEGGDYHVGTSYPATHTETTMGFNGNNCIL